MQDQDYKNRINAWDFIEESCRQFQPVSPAAIKAAHRQSIEHLLGRQAELESQSYELNSEMLTAVSGLMAMKPCEEKRISFGAIIKALQIRRGYKDDR